MLNWASFWKQLGGNFLTINAVVDQTLCTIIINWTLIQTETKKYIKIAVKIANLCGKDMPYAHFAEICGNLRNMRQSHICIKLTCLTIRPPSYNINSLCIHPMGHGSISSQVVRPSISAYMNNYVNVQQGRGILRMTCSRLQSGHYMTQPVLTCTLVKRWNIFLQQVVYCLHAHAE